MNSTETPNTQTINEKALDYAFRSTPYRVMEHDGVPPQEVIEAARMYKRFLETGE